MLLTLSDLSRCHCVSDSATAPPTPPLRRRLRHCTSATLRCTLARSLLMSLYLHCRLYQFLNNQRVKTNQKSDAVWRSREECGGREKRLYRGLPPLSRLIWALFEFY
ncbi:Uncharacterized protein Rs2_28980 [Raphanus sativus]|nr:Uncharacterized protein Rs2_28980 [Raphanus sativus]